MNYFKDTDWKPLALVPVLALLVLPFIGSPSTWLTLTVAGLAMGMIIFIIASGLTLVFGLMDVLNFGHGVFIALGAFVATSVLGAMGDYTASGSLWVNLLAVLPAMVVAMLVAGAIGLAFERFIVRPVYGNHLKQILITMGGMIIGEELIKVIWGPLQIPLPLPEGMRGSLFLGDAAIEKYRLIAVVVGLAVFGVLLWTLTRTKIGLLIRAGVQDREMVESLGYRIKVLFVGVFMVGSALAGLGGVMWGLYQQNVAADGRAGQRADLHRADHRRPGLHHRRAGRRAAGRPDGQLHRLPGAEDGAVLQHPADDGHPAVAAAGRLRAEQVSRPC
ncbi:MAG: inner-rane translocator [Ramlibacter sp.]|nr:inner-rane translocator [Ramlibacter sp.]